jgi:hypothetical protein
MPASKQAPKRELVASPEFWDLMTLVKHARLRHRGTIRFITKNEHEQSHRIFDSQLDHTHAVPAPEEPEEEKKE